MARVLLAALFVLTAGCEESCLSSDEGCTIPTPCEGIEFSCGSSTVSVRTLVSGDAVVSGVDALAAPGDVVLSNGVVTAVIDALDHPHYIAPTGGQLLDLTSADEDNDGLSHVFHSVGLLPGDAFFYETLTTEQGPGFAAIQVHGRLDGFEDVRVATRYEIRGCEPGIRVRTEIVNRAIETRIWALVDAWYWSGREAVPFAPGEGRGFDQPGIESPVESSWLPQPYFAAATHTDRPASYFEVACNEEQLFGFHSEQISAVGTQPRVVQPRSHEIFERFIGVAASNSIGPASDHALEIRRQLFEEEYVLLSGQLIGRSMGDEARATIMVSQASAETPVEERIPITQITPGIDGMFAVRVPQRNAYQLEVLAFGRVEETVYTEVSTTDVVVSPITIGDPAEINITVTVDGAADHAQVFVRPADDATRDAVEARLFDSFTDCAPLLGAPHGSSPACDRVLVNGSTAFNVPPGRYDLYATAGIFATIARETVDVTAGSMTDVSLAVSRLDLRPAGTLGADFHVHGGASFDSTIPDFDRVRAFLAANIDVIAATDHDVVWDYADARAALSADDRMAIMIGLEATGQILFPLTPGNDIPQVIGHWNVWPLVFDREGPYRGAPWDELVEPGALFERFVGVGWPRDTGVIQLNHPWSPSQFGRALGFPRALEVDTRVPLPTIDDGTGQGRVRRIPPGATLANDDYHSQEVMNGTENEDLVPFRTYWFYLLNQGLFHAGTANSDSHTLVDNVLGTPRTIVWTDQTVASFNEAEFNRSVRAGRMVGTNGPVLEVTTNDVSGRRHGPSLEVFQPEAGATLAIRLTAAPWVPVQEIRIIVNGVVARTLAAELTHPTDPFGTDGLVRFDGDVALSEILPSTGDAWIVVEAGTPLVAGGDLNCDGVDDTGDNNRDGVFDYRDVDRNDDDVVDMLDIDELDGDVPEECDPDQELGPAAHPPAPARGSPGYSFLAVTPGGYPMSFTNPFVIDRTGDGFVAPGLP